MAAPTAQNRPRQPADGASAPCVLLAPARGADDTVQRALDAAGFDVRVSTNGVPGGSVVDVAAAMRPDAVVLASHGPGVAAGIVRRIARALPSAAIVVVVESDPRILLLAGATAVLPPETDADRLATSVHAALDGFATVPAAAARLLAERAGAAGAGAATRLTGREREVLEGLLEGATTAQIADRLGVTPVTVRRHVSGVLHKIGVPDRAALASALTAPDPPALEEDRDETGLPAAPALTGRERAVLRLAATGLGNAAIAQELVIAPSTVRNHLTRITAKLGARNRAHAAVLATRHRLL